MRKFGVFFGGGALLLVMLGVAGGQQPGGFGRGGFGGFGGFGGGGISDPIALVRNPQVRKELDISEEQIEKIPGAVSKALAEVLTDKQAKRLHQIVLQQRGSAAFKDPAVQKELKITDEQVRNIDTVLEDSRKELAEAFKEAKGGNFQGVREKLQNMRKETNEKVLAVLSAEQRKAYRQMLGEEFKLEQRGFGGGGGFGGKGRKKRDIN
jgi:predicted metal-dependent peptidase